jgi:hypothetical protein
MDRARPAKDPDEPQTVEARVAVNPFVDLHRRDRFTIAIAWQPIELARTTVRTIAVNELPCSDAPLHGHESLPSAQDLAQLPLQLIELPSTTTQQTLLLGCDIQCSAG